MTNNKQSIVEMMWDEIDNLFPFKDSVEAQKFCAILDKYKAMHKEEQGKTWDAAMDNFKARGENYVRAYGDFDDYYNETFGGNK
jgi:hypothetical protein